MQLPRFFTFILTLFCAIQNASAQDIKDIDDSVCGVETRSLNSTKKRIQNRKGTAYQNIKPHSFPATVIMTVGGYLRCGATILNEEWVLSAANCVNSTDPNYYSFLAGRHDRKKQEESEQKVSAIAVFVHEGYTKTLQNDIVLFKVSPKFTFNDQVNATVLAPKDWNRRGMASVIGWMKTAQYKCLNAIQKLFIPIVPNDKCENIMGNIYDTNICAGTFNEDECQVDSGSPLYFKDNGTVVQIGIASWGDGCGKHYKLAVFTRISKYLDWIKKKTGI